MNNFVLIGELSESSETAVNEPEGKRRRRGRGMLQGARVLARALLECEDRRDKRHRELMELEERRLRMEADRTEMSRQGFAGLVSAVNNLSGAIHSLVSHHLHHSTSGQR